MKKIVLSLLASMAVATPALANEARIEGRGGVFWGDGYTQDVYGVALGYDFDLGTSTFAGVEVSGDKVADTGTKVAWGFTGRAGAKLGDATKVYLNGGYTTEPCDLCDGSWHAGAGAQQGFGQNFYGKVEYRHYFTQNNNPDANAVMVGAGIRF